MYEICIFIIINFFFFFLDFEYERFRQYKNLINVDISYNHLFMNIQMHCNEYQ